MGWRLIGNFRYLLSPLDKSFETLLVGETEKAMVPHSSTLAWKTPCTEEPGRLWSMGSLGVGLDWATSFSLFTFIHWRRKWQPTPVFLPGESQGWGTWWAAIYGVAQGQTGLKWLSSNSRWEQSQNKSLVAFCHVLQPQMLLLSQNLTACESHSRHFRSIKNLLRVLRGQVCLLCAYEDHDAVVLSMLWVFCVS